MINKNKIEEKLKKHKYHNMTDEQKQKGKDYQKIYRKNMSDEQKQKYRQARKYKYHNMTDEQKQKYIEAIKVQKNIEKNIEKI